MESDYGAVDGFDEPPHAFISSLLSKPIIEKKLADRFFQGDERRAPKPRYEALTEEELEKFFVSEFGGGTFRAGREYSFVLYGASGYTGSLCFGVHFENGGKSRGRVTFALAGRARTSCARDGKR